MPIKSKNIFKNFYLVFKKIGFGNIKVGPIVKSFFNAELTTVVDGDKLMKYLAAVDGNHPDIIFLDINMPRKDGKTCLKEIREIEELKKVPVIMFSTSSHPTDIAETFKNGANLYISKSNFYNGQVKIPKNIFALNWQEELLKQDKNRFILHTRNGFM